MSTQTSLPRWTPGPYTVRREDTVTFSVMSWDGTEPNDDYAEWLAHRVCLIHLSARVAVFVVDKANTHLLTSAPDFAAACTGHHYPDVDRLTWLAALISRFQEINVDVFDADPEAEATMLSECEGLLADLRAAMDKANGGRP